MRGRKISEKMEKWEDRKDLVFLMCAWLEGWKSGKLFCLVGEKKRRMENIVYIN